MGATTPTQATQPATIYSELLYSLKLGTGVMLAQAPVLNACNRISIVGCDKNLPFFKSISKIYSGVLDNKPPSLRHFLVGIDAHLVKEAARVGFKSAALTVLLPRLREYYKDDPNGKHKVNAIFAAVLSGAEMGINPADTIRTMMQAKRKFSDIPVGQRLAHLYTGAGLNGLRIFGVWYGFLYSDIWCSNMLKKHTSINPDSIEGILARVFPMSVLLTTPVWALEAIKNRLNLNRKLAVTAAETRTSRVFTAAKQMWTTQDGWKAFRLGYAAKVGYHGILAVGALGQALVGKWALQAKREQEAKLAEEQAKTRKPRFDGLIN